MTGQRDRTQRTRWTSLLAGAVALLLQIVAWAWMPAVIMSANAAVPTIEAKTGRIVICTPDGFRTVMLDDHGTPTDSDRGVPRPALSGDSCPLCPLLGGLALPPPALRVMPANVPLHSQQVLPSERIAAGWFLSTLQARAPPTMG